MSNKTKRALIAAVTAAIFLIFSAIVLYPYLYPPETEPDFWENVSVTEDKYIPPPKAVIDDEEIPPETPEDEKKPTVPAQAVDIPVLYSDLKAVNSGTVGWIYYPGLFSLPVMQSGDNSFYLKHNEYKKADKSGALFLDASCAARFSPAGLIHGHHLNKPSGFGQLEKLRGTDFFKSHRDFYVYDGTAFSRYRMFSVFAIGEGTKELQTSFSSEDDRERYINWLCDKSMYGCAAPKDSNIIQLNTCDYSFKGAHLIVCGFLVQ